MKKYIWLYILFILIWMAPLFLEVGSLIRFALEELRVLLVGILIGLYLGKGG